MLKKISSVPLFAIVLLSLLVKLIFFCYISPWDKKVEKEKIVISDSRGYEQLAERLLKYHTYAMPTDTFHISNYSDYQLTGYITIHPDSFRMPLYSTFMAAIYFIAGIKPYIVILVQILLSLLSVVLVYRISMLLFNKMEIAKIATLLFALDIHSAFVANQMLTDTISILLFLASIYLFLNGLLYNKVKSIFAGGLFMGLAVLTRGVFLFYPAIVFFIISVFSKQSLLWNLKSFSVYFLTFGCLAAIWSLRNEVKYGHFQFSTQDGDELLIYNVAYTEARVSHKNIDSIRIQLQKKADSLGFRNERDLFKQSEIYTKIGVDYIKKNKIAYLKTHLLGGLNMYLSIGNVGMAKMLGWNGSNPQEAFAEINSARILQNFVNNKKEALLGLLILLVFALEYLGTFLGLFSLWKNKQYLFLFLFLLTTVYFTAITGVVGTYRYKLMVTPFICIAAGYGYITLKIRKEKRDSDNTSSLLN